MDKIVNYSLEKYPSKFKGKQVFVDDLDSVYKVYAKDESPLFLSKNVL